LKTIQISGAKSSKEQTALFALFPDDKIILKLN